MPPNADSFSRVSLMYSFKSILAPSPRRDMEASPVPTPHYPHLSPHHSATGQHNNTHPTSPARTVKEYVELAAPWGRLWPDAAL